MRLLCEERDVRFNVQSGDCKRTVEAETPADAARQALREFHEENNGGMLGLILVISPRGWPAETSEFADDDFLMDTTVALKQIGLSVA